MVMIFSRLSAAFILGFIILYFFYGAKLVRSLILLGSLIASLFSSELVLLSALLSPSYAMSAAARTTWRLYFFCPFHFFFVFSLNECTHGFNFIDYIYITYIDAHTAQTASWHSASAATKYNSGKRV